METRRSVRAVLLPRQLNRPLMADGSKRHIKDISISIQEPQGNKATERMRKWGERRVLCGASTYHNLVGLCQSQVEGIGECFNDHTHSLRRQSEPIACPVTNFEDSKSI